MMNKSPKYIIIPITLALLVGLTLSIFLYASKQQYNNNATSGYVVNKENESNQKHYIHLLVFTKQGTKASIKIEIKDVNVWNLIEKDRAYFVNYSWRNNEMPVLEQIQINDKFKELYDKNLNQL